MATMINADQILLRTIGLNYVGLNLSKKLQITKDAEGFDENNVRVNSCGLMVNFLNVVKIHLRSKLAAGADSRFTIVKGQFLRVNGQFFKCCENSLAE